MTSTNPSVTTSRFLTLLTLLIIAGGLSTSCREQTPTPSSTPNLQPTGETIIVVKGGSIGVGFAENRFVAENAPKPKHYECASCNFSGIDVGPDEYNLEACQITNQNSTIHIKAGGGVKDIFVKRNPGKGILIDLDYDEYPPTSGIHYNANNKLDDVKLVPASLCACPDTGDGKCYIRIRASY